MNDNAVFGMTILPEFLWDLIDDQRGRDLSVPGAPKKLPGTDFAPGGEMITRDRRLRVLLLIYELGQKGYLADKLLNGEGERWSDAPIESLIEQYEQYTGVPADDIRRFLQRPVRHAPADGPTPPAGDTWQPAYLDP